MFDLTQGNLVSVPESSFIQEGILEKQHLQAALRENIAALGDDLLVISEEFGDFDDGRRRIDLLCIDTEARPVVVELKRTNDGGHMELQAIRYAAMVSALTFDDLVSIYERFLERRDQDPEPAKRKLAQWLDDAGGEESIISREVRIILASADFNKEITTTVLWLNDVYGTDIRCMRLTPYRIEGRLLLDIDQIIPLAGADELTINLRRREAATRVIVSPTKDWTKYIISVDGNESTPFNKRNAALAMVRAVHESGVSGVRIKAILGAHFLDVDGLLEGDELREAFFERYPKARQNVHRWFFLDPIQDEDRTWLLSKMWGLNTEAALTDLSELIPDGSISFRAAT